MTANHDWRAYSHEGALYLIRDVLTDDGEFAGHCEYAVRDGDEIAWRFCIEGVDFADIEPLARLTD